MAIVFRKWQNGQTFHMINIENRKIISVTKFRKGYSISIVSNEFTINDALGDEVSMPSTQEEFSRVYEDAKQAIETF